MTDAKNTQQLFIDTKAVLFNYETLTIPLVYFSGYCLFHKKIKKGNLQKISERWVYGKGLKFGFEQKKEKVGHGGVGREKRKRRCKFFTCFLNAPFSCNKTQFKL